MYRQCQRKEEVMYEMQQNERETGSSERHSIVQPHHLRVKMNGLKKKPKQKSCGIIGTVISIDSRTATIQHRQTDSSHFLLLATHWSAVFLGDGVHALRPACAAERPTDRKRPTWSRDVSCSTQCRRPHAPTRHLSTAKDGRKCSFHVTVFTAARSPVSAILSGQSGQGAK